MTKSRVRSLFYVASVYDFLIGVIFLFFGKQAYHLAAVPYPNHWGYLQFCSLMLMIFGYMFFIIARDPERNYNLIPYGILLKSSYVGIVGYYWMTSGCPFLFKPFLVIDFAMLILFGMAYRKLARPRSLFNL